VAFTLVAFVQLVIFLYAVASFMFNYSYLLRTSSLHIFVSGYFSGMYLASSSAKYRGNLPLANHLPMSASFQVPTFSHIIPILSFLA
jgi:hypothetical protein